jgi:glycosyltransferase involved in cell wall biosynthesis
VTLRASVVVPVHDAARELPGLFQCLARQSVPRHLFELLLVDDGSRDGTADVARALGAGAGGPTLVLASAGTGSYAARNTGIAAARAPLLAFTDADCAPLPEWLERGLAALQSAPRAAGEVRLVAPARPNLAALLDASRFLRQRRYVQEGFGATANLFVRREVFAAVGPFDPWLRSGGDKLFGRRAQRAGYPIAYAQDAIVEHPCRASFRALLAKAHRVGFGFGQLLGRAPGEAWRDLSWRIPDRITLAGGRALEERGWARPSAARRAALACGHGVLTAAVVAGAAHGAVHASLRRRPALTAPATTADSRTGDGTPSGDGRPRDADRR